MAKHEGWDSELFVVSPSEDDLCNICCQVLDDAVETQCGHSFCEKCIKEWLEQRQVCPQDQKPLAWEDCRPMIRDRRRILDLKVKCPWCETQMELRQLKEHKKLKCLKKPEDYEDEDEPEKVAEKKDAEPENEYVIELDHGAEGVDGGDADRKAAAAAEEKKIEEERRIREQKDAEDRDRRFAQQMQMQEQERARGLSVRPVSPGRPSQSPQPARQVSPSVQLVRPGPAIGEPHIEEFGQPQINQNGQNGGHQVLVEYYQADEAEGGFGEGQEGQPDYRGNGKNGLRPLPPKRSGCCGCSDRCWCCMCCFFWILLLVLGVSIWYFGVAGTAARVGL